MRIVSLLPSATEIICALGLGEQLVGVSHECDFPPGVEKLPVVTKTAIPQGLPSTDIDSAVQTLLANQSALYTLRMDVLETLMPDLLVTQALCDVCAVAASDVELAACTLPGKPEIVNLEPMNLEQVFDTFGLLGKAAHCESKATAVIENYRNRVASVKAACELLTDKAKPRVGFLEWIDPLYNGGHWTPELIEIAGGKDSFGSHNKPSYQISTTHLIEADPDVLFIALCGMAKARTEQDLGLLTRIPHWQSLRCVRNNRVYYTDGNAYFSRPGPRLVDSLEILAHCLHPTRFELPSSLAAAYRFTQ